MKNSRNIFSQPNIKENDHYIAVFPCYRIFSTSVLREALPLPSSIHTRKAGSRAVTEHCRIRFTWCIREAGDRTSSIIIFMVGYNLPAPSQRLCELVVGLQYLGWETKRSRGRLALNAMSYCLQILFFCTALHPASPFCTFFILFSEAQHFAHTFTDFSLLCNLSRPLISKVLYSPCISYALCHHLQALRVYVSLLYNTLQLKNPGTPGSE